MIWDALYNDRIYHHHQSTLTCNGAEIFFLVSDSFREILKKLKTQNCEILLHRVITALFFLKEDI